MTEKAVVKIDDMTLTFENNIIGEITKGELNELVGLELSSENGKEFTSFSYDEAIELRDFLDWLIDKANKEGESHDNRK